MVLKVYLMICTMIAVAAAALFVTGNFTAMVAIVLGFIAFGVVFMGMMFVLPFTVTHSAPAKPKVAPSGETVAVPSYGNASAERLAPGLVPHAR